jgi:glycopeptide antibiotics resistance protein
MRPLLIFTVLLLLYVSLYPWHFAYTPGHSFLLPLDFSDKKDIFLNAWVYVPLGALAYWSFPEWGAMRWPLALAIGAWLSVAVEMIQYYLPFRVSSQTDILANVIGTVGGAVLAAQLKNPSRLLRWTPITSRETFLLSCWWGYLVLPMVPVHGFYSLRMNVKDLLASPLTWTEVPIWAMAWVAVWHLLPGAFRTQAHLRVIYLGSLLLVPARLFIVTRTLGKSEIAGAVAGAICVMLLPRWNSIALAVGLAAALLLRDMSPFHFSSQASSFSWIPFQTFLSLDWTQGILLLAMKVSWYGFLVWFAKKSGLSWLQAGGLIASFLAVIEVAQRYNPAHIADVTDPLLALFCASGFYLL